MQTMHLFAGCGGGILADLILGHRPIVAVEWDKYCCEVLRARVSDGWFDGMQVWEGDVRMFDPSQYKGRVDCIHAGFPCQDISIAGSKAGVGEDTKSGLYREVLRIADALQPGYLFLENVSAIVTGDNGSMLRTVVGDLAKRGYDCIWRCISASQIGANHKRNRWWLLAYPNSTSGERMRKPKRIQQTQLSNSRCEQEFIPNSNSTHTQREKFTSREKQESTYDGKYVWWEVEPKVGRVADGLASASYRLKALGNGQVPLQCATAFSILWEEHLIIRRKTYENTLP